MNGLKLAGVALLALAAAAAGAFGYHHLNPPEPAPVAAPDMELRDLDGEHRQLADYRGQVVVMNFWATWCAPCLREIPMLIEAQAELGEQGVQVLGPALDDPEAVRRFAEQRGMNYPIFAGAEQIGPALVRMGDERGALPYTVVVDREGYIVDRHYGEMDRSQFDALIKPHL